MFAAFSRLLSGAWSGNSGISENQNELLPTGGRSLLRETRGDRAMRKGDDAGSSSRRPGVGRLIRLILLVNLAALGLLGVVGEVAFRLLHRPVYPIACDRWGVGSGQTEAGKRWWPETTYRVEGREFRTQFRTDARGYRARPEPPRTALPYRVAFVGDSFTEAIQVDH